MGKTLPSQVKDPAALPVGTEVGEWRVVSWCGRGSYGTVYRVERKGHEGEGPYALKLALHAGDKRFQREEELLSRLNHPNVPRLKGQGVWQHLVGNFPYLVMQWVAGVGLYQWAKWRNPTSRQVLRVLGQAARALEATHAVGGLHRDVKGDNVLVRLADEQAFLTDFGAGVYKGAVTLTFQPLPPSTPNYRSREAWDYQRTFAFHPSAHYQASACDELFALGVMAYRLVTDEYPPPTEPGLKGSEVWERRGPGPRPPRELNPNVSEELNAIIMRLLAQPERRFKGKIGQAAEALEHAADSAGPEADAPLFEWETVERAAWSREEQRHAELNGHRLRRRDRATVQRSEQQDVEVKAEAARLKEQELELARSRPQPQLVHFRERMLRWLPWVVPGLGGLLLAVGTRGEYEPEEPLEEPAEARAEARDAGGADGGTSGVGEEVLSAFSLEPVTHSSWEAVAVGKLKGPLPGQRKPPCPYGEEAIRGGCWFMRPDMKPPCGTGYYEWDRGCYVPIFVQQRQPTSDPP
jgi:serine/threonine protein kinase